MQKSTPEPQVVPSHTGSVQLLQSKSWPHVAVPSCTLPQQVESYHVGSSSGMLLRRYETLFKPVCVAAPLKEVSMTRGNDGATVEVRTMSPFMRNSILPSALTEIWNTSDAWYTPRFSSSGPFVGSEK